MNVLDMPGPAFLVFYGMLTFSLCAGLWWSIRAVETGAMSGPLRVRDPYEIAYLRGGIKELVKVAVLALIRRRLLKPSGDCVQADVNAAAAATASIERAIIHTCRSRISARTLAEFGTVKLAGLDYQRVLADKHFMPNSAMRTVRMTIAAMASALLGGIALFKIAHALDTGHQNIELLLVLALISVFAIFKIARHPRTADGDRALQHLNTLFGRVRAGPPPVNPEQLNEALLLAAVYGVYAQSATDLSDWNRLFPVPKKNSDGGGGSSCGGGCGSGCGGGGGCGGCGS